MAPAASAPPRRRRSLRPLIILVVIVVVAGGGYVMFGDKVADTLNVILYGEPGLQQPVANASSVTAPAPPAAGAGAEKQGMAPSSAGSPQTPAAPPPAASPAPTAPQAAVATSNGPQAPEPGAEGPASETFEPTVPASEPTSPARAPTQAGPITPEQDLPSVLDRIRRERVRSASTSTATVDRSPQTVASAGPVAGMVSVNGELSDERDDAERAYDLLLHGQYQGALALYDQVLKIDDKSLPGLLGKAIALHKLRNFAEARQLYQRVLAIDPNNREALTNFTSLVATQAPAVALAELRELQKTNPDFSPIPAEVATIEANSGNLIGAISSFNRAIQLSPENGLYRLNLAILQDRAGMVAEAVASYQAALDRLNSGAQLPIPVDGIRARLRYLRTR